MARIILARHHHGGGRPPAVAGGVREDVFTRDYGAHAEDALVAAGHEVLVVSGVPYADGWAVAKSKRADVFVAMHANSGRASQPDAYGLIGFDYRSATSKGATLASRVMVELNAELKRHAPDGTRVSVWATRPEDWTKDLFGTIRGCGSAVGLCYEPVFLDAPEHAKVIREPKHVGLALARGIISYLEGR